MERRKRCFDEVPNGSELLLLADFAVSLIATHCASQARMFARANRCSVVLDVYKMYDMFNRCNPISEWKERNTFEISIFKVPREVEVSVGWEAHNEGIQSG